MMMNNILVYWNTNSSFSYFYSAQFRKKLFSTTITTWSPRCTQL